MVAIRRFVASFTGLPPWLKFIYLIAVTWAIGHCAITAYGTQDQRFVAAVAGVIGAVCILVVLHVGIAYYVNQIARKDAELEMLRAVVADATSQAGDRDSLAPDRAVQDRRTA